MPLLRLETTVALTEDKRQALLASLSKIVAETIGKPEQYVMVTASQAAMQMSGRPMGMVGSTAICGGARRRSTPRWKEPCPGGGGPLGVARLRRSSSFLRSSLRQGVGQRRFMGKKGGKFLYSCNNRIGRCINRIKALGMKNLRTRTCRFSGQISDWPSQNHSSA